MISMQQLVQRVRGSSTFELAFTGRLWNPSGKRILVFDSSFNPPTNAHAALARVPDTDGQRADATLLLLSVTNADKMPKAGDATPEQRLEMMALLAHELGEDVAIAAIDAPTFVGKARALQTLGAVHLGFAMGADTLTRLVRPSYYGSEDAMHNALHAFFHNDKARVTCARRGSEPVPDAAHRYMDAGLVSIVELDERAEGVSSSAVRDKIVHGDNSWRDMVSSSIAQYILDHGLYTPAT